MKTGASAAATVFVDADNTLWDTDGVFSTAQLDLLAGIELEANRSVPGDAGERLAFIRAADQELAQRHHAGLRYPPRLLINTAAAALLGSELVRAARLALNGALPAALALDAVTRIETAYFSNLARQPVLRPGVEAGLRALEAAGCSVLIITEGARRRVEKTADQLGLKGHFTRIIEGAKRPDLYRRILRLAKVPQHAFMVGDQLDRDIAPAKAAGLDTIYFPGGFRPRWTPDVETVRPDHVITSFDEVPGIVLAASRPSRLTASV